MKNLLPAMIGFIPISMGILLLGITLNHKSPTGSVAREISAGGLILIGVILIISLLKEEKLSNFINDLIYRD